ncbi:hypothetical protein IJ541_11305, partial [bacterium]|nr:hypothetical protein [bacterium]
MKNEVIKIELRIMNLTQEVSKMSKSKYSLKSRGGGLLDPSANGFLANSTCKKADAATASPNSVANIILCRGEGELRHCEEDVSPTKQSSLFCHS